MSGDSSRVLPLMSVAGQIGTVVVPFNPDCPISFYCGGALLVFTLKSDGTIERGPGYRSDDQASLAFLDSLARCAPCFVAALRNRVVELEEENRRLSDELSGIKAGERRSSLTDREIDRL